MRKKYITPTLRTARIAPHGLLAASPNVTINNSDAASIEADEVEVKGRGAYNVWNEDWSK